MAGQRNKSKNTKKKNKNKNNKNNNRLRGGNEPPHVLLCPITLDLM